MRNPVSVHLSEIDTASIQRLDCEDVDYFKSVELHDDEVNLRLCSDDILVEGTNLLQAHLDMFKTGNMYKRSLPSKSRFSNNCLDMVTPKIYMVLKVIPYNLFSDDTGGNSTSKWNKYDVWSLNVAAVPLSMANHYLNHLLICGSNKHDALDQLRYLTNDLENLEKGIEMYDAETKEEVLVVAPLLFIKADNPRHADITCVKHSTASYPCRKCYWCRHADDFPVNRNTLIKENYDAPKRQKCHWESLFGDSQNALTPESILVQDKHGNQVTTSDFSELGFKENNGKYLLGLSSWDPSKDTPVEILHGLCLGLIKYTYNKTADCFFKKDQIDVVTRLCQNYSSKVFSNMSNDLQGYESFFGRDFKLMIQMLPTVLIAAKNCPQFSNFNSGDSEVCLKNIIDAFDSLGELCSLCYTSEIHSNFDKFLKLLEKTAKRCILALDKLDTTIIPTARRARTTAGNQLSRNERVLFDEADSRQENISNEDNTAYRKSGGALCNRLKTHLIVHLVDDCKRFGSPVLLATEKNEQFNKNIRAIVFKTNKQNPSRDLALISSREVMLRSIVMGTTWDNGTKKAGSMVENWLRRFGDSFFFNANREYGMADYISSKKLSINTVAIFDLNSGSIDERRVLAKVTKKQRNIIEIEMHNLLLASELMIFDDDNIGDKILFRDDGHGNPLTEPTGEILVLEEDQLTIVELLDMSHKITLNQNEYFFINKHRFGTFWWLKKHKP